MDAGRQLVRHIIVLLTVMSLVLVMLVPAVMADDDGNNANITGRAVYDNIEVHKIDNGSLEQPGKVIYAKRGSLCFVYTYDPNKQTLSMLSWDEKIEHVTSTTEINLPSNAGSLVIGPDGDIFFTGITTGKLYKYSASTLDKIKEVDTGSQPGAIAFNQNSNKVYVAHTGQNSIYEYSYPDLTRTSNTIYTPGPVYSVAGGAGNAVVYPDYFVAGNQSELISYIPGSSSSDSFGVYEGKLLDLFGVPASSPEAWLVKQENQINYLNGVHTIEWTKEDNAGNQDGIGSRYFSINNDPVVSREDSLDNYIAYQLSHTGGTLTIFDLKTGSVLGTASGLGNPESVDISEDGRYAVVVDDAFAGFYFIDFAPEADEPEDPVYTIGLTQNDAAVTDIAVAKGKTVKIVAQAYIDGVYNAKLTKKIKWATSDKKIATVSKGKIKGKKAGMAIITASLKTEGVSAAVNVTVN